MTKRFIQGGWVGYDDPVHWNKDSNKSDRLYHSLGMLQMNLDGGEGPTITNVIEIFAQVFNIKKGYEWSVSISCKRYKIKVEGVEKTLKKAKEEAEEHALSILDFNATLWNKCWEKNLEDF